MRPLIASRGRPKPTAAISAHVVTAASMRPPQRSIVSAHCGKCAGQTGLAFRSSKPPSAGRSPIRQKKRHFGSAPVIGRGRSRSGSSAIAATHSSSALQIGTSTFDGVAPTW